MSDFNPIKPPQWPLKCLRFFLKREYLEEIEGDMEEIFHEQVERSSPQRARRMYTWEMIKLLRPILIRNLKEIPTLNQPAMLKNYVKTSVRSLMKNPVSSFINIFGLSVAIGVCLVVYSFIDFDARIDQFHENKNHVFLTTIHANRDGALQQYGTTPRPLGEMLRDDFASISKVCRIADESVVLKNGDNVFPERVRFVDAAFLEMFTFPLQWGSSRSLADLNSIILSEPMAKKYFGDENPVGRDMLMVFEDGRTKAFSVAGVAAPFPKARAIEFTFLVNFKNIETAKPVYDVHDWSEFLTATLIQVNNPADVSFIQQRMERYKTLQNEVQHDRPISSFEFVSLADLHQRSGNIRSCISYDENREGRIGMPIIALFMLILACFNYINIAIVSAAKRLKEIAVRKVIGAHRIRVIIQFLTENMVVTFFALVVGVAMGAFIFLPWFVQFSGWELEVMLWDGKFWVFLVLLMFITGVASGIYPAFYISHFDAVRIFKGTLQFGKKNPLTKIFLGIQLVLACMTITAAVVFTQNNHYQNNKSWGYNQHSVLYVKVPDGPAYEKMNAIINQNPDVVQLAGSKDHLGKSQTPAVVHVAAGRQYEVAEFSVDADYFETMGLQLKTGRVFKKHSRSDKKCVVVNELLVKNFNLENPIGSQLEIDSIKYEVIGVLSDFHANSFFIEMQPAIFTLALEADFRFLSMRVNDGKNREVLADVQKQWTKLFPEIPFQGGHQEDVWGGFFFSVDRSEAFNKVIAGIAVMLACLGLYGLVTLNVSGRLREFSIRKTLGAGVTNITSLIGRQYLPLTVVAMIFGAPISYLFAKAYLNMLFAYPMPMDYSGIVLSLVILILILLAVISTQIRKVLKANPIDGLKSE